MSSKCMKFSRNTSPINLGLILLVKLYQINPYNPSIMVQVLSGARPIVGKDYSFKIIVPL